MKGGSPEARPPAGPRSDDPPAYERPSFVLTGLAGSVADVRWSPAPWIADAACRGLTGPERDLWHPDKERYLRYAVARRICAGCPVRLECVHEGLDLLSADAVMGMWGGLTPSELRRLARDKGVPHRPAAEHGTRARYVGNPGRGQAGCRCETCRTANARREHERRIGVKREPALV